MLVIFGLILVALIAIVGGDRGVMSLIALAGNLLILCIAIWLIASGVPVFPVTICLSVVICCITLFYQNGINRKTLSAFTAVLITIFILFFAIYYVVCKSGSGGLNEIQSVSEDVLYYNMNLNIPMQKVMAAVVLLSTLGAVTDMALTVSTSLYEVKIHKPDMSNTELFQSGMQIGKSILGTTVNTLILSFADLGESMILFAGHLPMQKQSLGILSKFEAFVFQNCIFMIFGALSCVLVIPISTLLMKKLCGGNHDR